MFFLEDFVTEPSLKQAWLAAHGQGTSNKEEIVNLPKTCEAIELFVRSEDKDPRKRISINTGSKLVNGAARLRLREADKLQEDCHKLYRLMIKSKNVVMESNEDECDTVALESVATPEIQRFARYHEPDHSMVVSCRTSPPIRHLETPSSLIEPRMKISDSCHDISDTEAIDYLVSLLQNFDDVMPDEISEEEQANIASERFYTLTETEISNHQTSEKATQTDPLIIINPKEFVTYASTTSYLYVSQDLLRPAEDREVHHKNPPNIG